MTLSGIKVLKLNVKDKIVESVTVDMLEPKLKDENLFAPSEDLPEGIFVSMGNPHYVIFTEKIDEIAEIGQKLERHPAFPQRCNIELARVMNDGSIKTRVWERGSGITMACGTGACATAVAAFATDKAGRKCRIIMDGGTLDVEWRESDNHVMLIGPAEFVFDGEIND